VVWFGVCGVVRQFGTGRQAFHIAPALHGPAANPVAALYCLGKPEVFQQGTDYADGKPVTCANGVNHTAYRYGGNEFFGSRSAVKRTLGAQFDHNGFRALIEIERGNVGRIVVTGQ